MKVYRKAYAAQKTQRYLTVTILAWFLSIIGISTVGMFISAIQMTASIILGCICLSRESTSKKDLLHETTEINTQRTEKISKILFFACSGLAVIGVCLCAVFCEKDFDTTYGTLTYISKLLIPLQFLFVPAYPKASVHAANSCSVLTPIKNFEPKRKIRLGSNVCLLVIGFLSAYAMLFYAYPAIYKTSDRYGQSQDSYLKNDISPAVIYKSEKADDCDIEAILENLPGYNFLQNFSLDENLLTVIYEENDSEQNLQGTVVYNATALFALIDDLKQIDFIYGGQTVTVYRKNVVEYYEDFSQILKEWQMDVSLKMQSEENVKKAFEKITENN